MNHGILIRAACALGVALVVLPAIAGDISLIGTFRNKAAVLAIDGGEPRSVRIGQSVQGITLLEVGKDHAVVESAGARLRLELGRHYPRASQAQGRDARQSVTLSADPRGHFWIEGMINGGVTRFMVDTGATSIAMPASEANRLAIDYRGGRAGITQTANGPVRAFAVTLDTVRVGDIELRSVECVVLESGLDITLLGMSFLNRVEMRRDGQTMTLIRRF